MTIEQRLAKLVRRAPRIQSQAHLDTILRSFPKKNRKLAIESIGGILPARLVAKEPAPLEVKPRDPQNPTVAEETVMRLNQQAAKLIEQSGVIAEMDKTIRDLRKELADEKGKEK